MTRYTRYIKRFNKAELSAASSGISDHPRPSKAPKEYIEKMIRMRKKVCLKCRKRGHTLQDCPDASADNSLVSLGRATQKNTGPRDVRCYKCGASDHTSKSCSVSSSSYKYATCFVCQQTGHLASQCAQNPRGLYPNGGGCRFCGSVRHLVKDCEERRQKELDRGEEVSFEEPELTDLQVEDATLQARGGNAKKTVSFFK